MPVEEPGGLSGAEAERRLAEHGRNEMTEVRSAPLYSRVISQLGDPLIMVLLGAALLTIVIGDHADAVVIGLVIVFNTTVGVHRGVDPELIQVSLERNVHCATGHCGHCQLGPLLLCRDGPVVSWTRAQPLLMVGEL